MAFLAQLNRRARRGAFERLSFCDGYSNEPVETLKPFGPKTAASPGKDYGASFFENSSGKENISSKNLHSGRGATRNILLVESSAGNHYNCAASPGERARSHSYNRGCAVDGIR